MLKYWPGEESAPLAADFLEAAKEKKVDLAHLSCQRRPDYAETGTKNKTLSNSQRFFFFPHECMLKADAAEDYGSERTGGGV